eukprot:CAMPEP_0171442558 /NCGR_PEP_ID=MMETSP0881-20121228/28510_1 /TAXON_ID=67004 /ORGANISM="Thalassiosira weissflogii, Strain CCMP1336" /LENGTH=88 /DNA_ID=CAMNT_0011965707 /DNA_START=1 /DNA_END=263 /DNA_ORIENTATION=-
MILKDLENQDITSFNSSAIFSSGVAALSDLELLIRADTRENKFLSATSSVIGVADPEVPVISVEIESLLEVRRSNCSRKEDEATAFVS